MSRFLLLFLLGMFGCGSPVMDSYIGAKFVKGKDTLVCVDYSVLHNSLIMSDGSEIDFDLIKNN